MAANAPILDLVALGEERPWLYPLTIVLQNLLAMSRVNPIWLALLGGVLLLLMSADRVFDLPSSGARQRFRLGAAAQDLALFFLQFGLGRLLPAGLFVLTWGAFVPDMASRARLLLGLSISPQLPAVVPLGGLVVCVAVAQDFARYGMHRLFHQVPWLWSLHQFHHSAESLTTFTTFREHPLLLMLGNLASAAVAALVATPALMLFPHLLDDRSDLVGGMLAFVVLKAAHLLGHYHRPLSWGLLDHWIITPAVHAIHHSLNPRHHAKNFGGFVTLWDRLFGTYHAPVPQELADLRFGVDEARPFIEGRWLPLRFLYGTLTLRALAQLVQAWRCRVSA